MGINSEDRAAGMRNGTKEAQRSKDDAMGASIGTEQGIIFSFIFACV